MNRRTFLKTAAAPALLTPLRAAGARPNILIVMTDQQFSEAMSCRIGHQYIHTPHMDSLASTGTLFTRAYCPNPLCVPSRTSMFTGRYPAETGVETNDTTPIDARRFPVMGSMFRNAGYNTAYFGKWHLPSPQEATEIHGFETGGRTKMKGDDGIAASAAGFLRSVKQDKPFLAVTSLVNPHNICQWARGEDLPDGPIGAAPPPEQCPPVRANLEPQKNDPDIIPLISRSYQGTKMFPVGNFDANKWRQYIWAYYRMIEKVDGLVGQVLGALREARLEERTLVVFLADHGDCQGAHRWNQKTVLYDEATRVPLILSWKGVTKRGTSDALAHTGADLIPTPGPGNGDLGLMRRQPPHRRGHRRERHGNAARQHQPHPAGEQQQHADGGHDQPSPLRGGRPDLLRIGQAIRHLGFDHRLQGGLEMMPQLPHLGVVEPAGRVTVLLDQCDQFIVQREVFHPVALHRRQLRLVDRAVRRVDVRGQGAGGGDPRVTHGFLVGLQRLGAEFTAHQHIGFRHLQMHRLMGQARQGIDGRQVLGGQALGGIAQPVQPLDGEQAETGGPQQQQAGPDADPGADPETGEHRGDPS